MVIIEDLKDSEDYLNKNKLLRNGRTILHRAMVLGADEAEVFLIKGKSTSIDIENNRISFSSTQSHFGYGIRVIKDRRMGFGFGSMETEADSIIHKALKLSKLGTKINYHFPGARSNPDRIQGTFDPDMLDIDLTELRKMAVNMIDAARSVKSDITVTNGGIALGVNYLAVLNSNGLEAADALSSFSSSIYCVMKKNQISTGFEHNISPALDFDPRDVGQKAGSMAVNYMGAKKLPRKVNNVIFTPDSLARILEFTLAPALSGESAMKGGSFYSGKIGSQVASNALNIRDNPTMPHCINSSVFDDEGIQSHNNVVVDHGILKSYLYTLSSAADADVRSTGNATRSEGLSNTRNYRATPKTFARNLILESNSKLPPRNDIHTLISDVDKGILCYDVMGAHTANPASGEFSVNSPIAFYVEGGEIKHPIKPVMMSGSMQMVLQNIMGVGSDFKQLKGSLTPVGMYLPSIWVQGIKVSI